MQTRVDFTHMAGYSELYKEERGVLEGMKKVHSLNLAKFGARE